jgi:hypothetical protein
MQEDERSAEAWRAACRALGAIGLAALAASCSLTDDFYGGRPAPPGAASGSFAERFRTLFGSGSPAASASAEAAQIPDDIDCPRVDIRQGAATLMMNAPNTAQASLGLRYQATFGRTARECAARDGALTIKVGVQGRLIVGPAGGPGDTQLPLRYALVREGVEPKTLWSRLYVVPVTIAPGAGEKAGEKKDRAKGQAGRVRLAGNGGHHADRRGSGACRVGRRLRGFRPVRTGARTVHLGPGTDGEREGRQDPERRQQPLCGRERGAGALRAVRQEGPHHPDGRSLAGRNPRLRMPLGSKPINSMAATPGISAAG